MDSYSFQQFSTIKKKKSLYPLKFQTFRVFTIILALLVNSELFTYSNALKIGQAQIYKKLVKQQSPIVALKTKSLRQETPFEKNQKIYDYVIIGGGISGLHAAKMLAQKNKDFILLEAQQKVGGKIFSVKLTDIAQLKYNPWFLQNKKSYQNQAIDIGAAEVEPNHKTIKEYAKEKNLTLAPLHQEGDTCFLYKGKSYIIDGLGEDLKITKELDQIIEVLKQKSEKFKKAKQITTNQKNKKYKKIIDSSQKITAQKFIKNQLKIKTPLIKDLLLSNTDLQFGIENDKVSSRYVLEYETSFNDITQLLVDDDDDDDEQQQQQQENKKINGGNQIVIDSLRKDLQTHGKPFIKTNHQVWKIDNSNHEKYITVHAFENDKYKNNKVSFKGKKVFYGLPMSIGKQIQFSKLSKVKRILFDSVLSTEVIKSFLFFKKPITKPSLNGQIYFGLDYLSNLAMDLSPQNKTIGIYVFFHSKSKIKSWNLLPKEQKKQYLVNLLVKGYDIDDKNENLKEVLNSAIHAEYELCYNKHLKGAFSTMFPPGFYSKILNSGNTFNQISKQDHGISFIGSEFCEEFPGYMEGGMLNSQQEVLKSLGEDQL